jgi:hypothetical protein
MPWLRAGSSSPSWLYWKMEIPYIAVTVPMTFCRTCSLNGMLLRQASTVDGLYATKVVSQRFAELRDTRRDSPAMLPIIL